MDEDILFHEKPEVLKYSIAGITFWIVLGFIIVFPFLLIPSNLEIVTLLQIITTLIGTIIMVLGSVFAIPFAIYREIVITKHELYVRWGFNKDKIPLENVAQVGIIEEPKKPQGIVSSPFGYGFGFLLIPVGVVKSKASKWYLFGSNPTYYQIRIKTGRILILGINNSERFTNFWQQLRLH